MQDPLETILNKLFYDSMNEVAFQNRIFPQKDIQHSTIHVVADVQPESIRIIRRHHDTKTKSDQRYINVIEE
jgi:hypothetical protein